MIGLFIIVIGLLLLILLVQVLILFKHEKVLRDKESEYYTDYRNKNLIIRIFKPEFEYQAIGNVSIGKILDRGDFSATYMWALIEI